MPKLTIRGVKSFRSKGRWYHYHRATSIRIDIDLESNPARFLAKVRELDDLHQLTPAAVLQAKKTLGDMFDAWRASEEWNRLKLETRQSYERVTDPSRGTIYAVRCRPIVEFSTPFVVALRDAVKAKNGRWAANYTVKVLRQGFAWGRLHGWGDANPAKGVPLLLKPADAPIPNRAWTATEFNLVWDRADQHLKVALALAYYAGLRVSDVVAVPWSAWDGQHLAWRQSKTGGPIHVTAPVPLRKLLNDVKRTATQIVVNRKDRPYTRDGLQSNLWRLIKSLEHAGHVQQGLCFHGLRHSLGAALYDLGVDREARKAALGHASDAASIVYERDGNRRAAADRAFAAIDRQLHGETNEK